MNILVLSVDGSAHPTAVSLSQWADVRYFQHGAEYVNYDGSVDYTHSWRPEVKWADMVICDSPYFSSQLSFMKDKPTTLYLDNGKSYELLNRIARNLPIPTIDALCDAIQIQPKRSWWRFWQRA